MLLEKTIGHNLNVQKLRQLNNIMVTAEFILYNC